MRHESDDTEEAVEGIKAAAALRELRRVLKLVYGDSWEEVYDDLLVKYDLDDYCEG